MHGDIDQTPGGQRYIHKVQTPVLQHLTASPNDNGGAQDLRPAERRSEQSAPSF